MGNWIVLAVLAAVVLLAAGSVCKTRKTGGCNGNCGSCKGCH